MWWSAKAHSNDSFEDSIPIVCLDAGNIIELGAIIITRNDIATFVISSRTYETS